jgi:hypothetical protein
MTILQQDIEMFQGETKVVTVSLTDGSGNPLLSLAGMTITWGCARTAHATPLFTKSTTAGTITTSGGDFSFEIAPADTEDLSAGKYYQQSNVVSSGKPYVAQTGDLQLKESLLS